MENTRRRKVNNLLTTLLVVILMAAFVSMLFSAGFSPPGEPPSGRMDTSLMLLDANPYLEVDKKLLPQEENEPEVQEPEQEQQQEEEPPADDIEELYPEGWQQEESPAAQPDDTESGTETSEGTAGGGTGGIAVPTDLVYFYTSIVDGASSAVRGYAFTITQNVSALQDYALTPVSVDVSVNGQPQQFNGSVLLYEGANTITVSGLYRDSEGEERRISKSYTVYYNRDDFFDHNLDNITVQTEEYSFYARLKSGTGLSPSARYSVMFNGETITREDGDYTVTLKPRNNTVTLVVSDNVNAVSYQQSFKIVYDLSAADTNRPVISTNLDGTATVNSRRFPLSVNAVSYKGERIYASGEGGSGLTVTLNGQVLNHGSSNTVFELYFAAGAVNLVSVEATDAEGYYARTDYEIYCNSVEYGAPIGTAVVSVEATTVGLGYLVPPTEVTIYEGVNAVYTVTEVLNNYGYQYNYSGSEWASFYLAYLIKDGITNGAEIPEDLAEKIEEDGLKWNNYSANSLGQSDFCEGSGWLFSVDGVYPTNGLSECYLLDGQVLRIRFSLAYGKDVGQPGGYGLLYSYGKEW